MSVVRGLLILTLLALSAGVVDQWNTPQPVWSPSASTAQSSSIMAQPMTRPITQLPPKHELREFEGRPLFAVGRRMVADSEMIDVESPKVDGSVSADGEGDISRFSVSAIVVDGDEQLLLLYDRERAIMTRAKPGDVIEGWTVGEIRVNSVLFINEFKRQILPLREYETIEETDSPLNPEGVLTDEAKAASTMRLPQSIIEGLIKSKKKSN